MTTEPNVLEAGTQPDPSRVQVATPEARDAVQEAWATFTEREKSRDPESGKFTPRNKLTAEPAEGDKPDVAPKGGDKPAAEEPEVETDEKTKDRVTVALRRARLSDGALKGLSEKDRTQLGLELAEQQENTDRLLRGKQSEGKEAESGKAGQAAKPLTPPAESLRAARAKVADMLVVGDGGGQLLEDYENQIVQRVLAEVASQPRADSPQDEMVTVLMAEKTRSRLLGELGELKDEKLYQKVYARMMTLGAEDKSGATAYDHIQSVDGRYEACMRDAYKLVAPARASSKPKSNGQVDIRDLRSNVKAQMAGVPHHVAVLKLLDQGYTPDQVRTILD